MGLRAPTDNRCQQLPSACSAAAPVPSTCPIFESYESARIAGPGARRPPSGNKISLAGEWTRRQTPGRFGKSTASDSPVPGENTPLLSYPLSTLGSQVLQLDGNAGNEPHESPDEEPCCAARRNPSDLIRFRERRKPGGLARPQS